MNGGGGRILGQGRELAGIDDAVSFGSVTKNPNLKYLSKEEQELPYSNFESEDYKEGLSAFLNHQNPNFQNK